LGSGAGWLRDRLAFDEVRTIGGRIGVEAARLRPCGWLAEGVGRIKVVSAITVEGGETGADEGGKLVASCAWEALEIGADGSGFDVAAAVCGTVMFVVFSSWAAMGVFWSAVPRPSLAKAASRTNASLAAGEGDGERETDGECESVGDGDTSPTGRWSTLFDRSSSYPRVALDVDACSASNDSTMAPTMVGGPAEADAAGAVLLLLLRLRFPVRLKCSMLLDVLNNLRASRAPGDFPSPMVSDG